MQCLYLSHLREVANGSCHTIAIKAESIPPSAFSLSIHKCQPLYRYIHAPAAYTDVATNTTAIPCTMGVHVPAAFPGCLS